jgi:hypothetical protein
MLNRGPPDQVRCQSLLNQLTIGDDKFIFIF